MQVGARFDAFIWSCVVLTMVPWLKGSEEEDALVVTTRYGSLKGVRKLLNSDSYVDKFLNIPFAKPPVGDLRFRKPEPPEKWNGTRDATRFGDICIQPKDNYLLPSQVFNQSEDCLYLSVYRPKVSESSGGGLPVMVWIHGGGLITGTGNRFLWSALAQKGVVVVTINYRLGALGFLSTEDSAIPGNYGLWDQVMALQWVRDVISSFGGDPQNVCIFGESAGGASVSLLLLAQGVEGLFHKAIMESGVSMVPWATSLPTQHPSPREQAHTLASRLQCTANDSAALLQCLRTREPRAFLNSGGVEFSPVAEGLFGESGLFADVPANLIRRNNFTHVPTIRGYNADEAGLFFNDPGDQGFSLEETQQKIGDLVTPYLKNSGRDQASIASILQTIQQAYLNQPPITDRRQLRQAYLKLSTDFDFVAGVYREAEMVTAYDVPPQFLYRFSFRSPARLNPAWKGTIHVDEVPYVSGAPLLDIQVLPNFVSQWTQADRNVSDQIGRMWTSFAKFSNPMPNATGLDGVKWLPWQSNQQQLLDIGQSLSLLNDPVTAQQKMWIEIISGGNLNSDKPIG